ncbi:hypothetical protein TrVE_jg188 [Triparma verrucosa]|uniref:Uncharacterized protein n=1 Tax=Triparma verrucosa TaxID=1606542 RepID=A0A9W7B9E8_9STRA|nr:hypothetical protein TrVE_jg188 [Triparma verrucosa]
MPSKGYSTIPQDEDAVQDAVHPSLPTSKTFRNIIVTSSILLLLTFLTTSSYNRTSLPTLGSDSKSLFDEYDRFIFEDYDERPPHSNFLPGVAGVYGKPVWTFYVNRGQSISSFGTSTKDFPLLEFNPANKAYQSTALGFRTFFNVTGREELSVPFEEGGERVMYVGSNELEITDVNDGIKTAVKYFTLPEEEFSALVRRVTVENVGEEEMEIQMFDGLARMEPAGGMLDGQMKNMGRTLEGWMGVYHGSDDLTMPFYKLSTQPSDTAQVKVQVEGHYCLSFVEEAEGPSTLLPIVYDTDKIFGSDTSLMKPKGLEGKSVEDILNMKQSGAAKTSSAFAAVSKRTLKPGQNFTITSYYGKAKHIDRLKSIASVITSPKYTSKKFTRARTMIDEITSSVSTKTSNGLFNGHIKQMFLDNALRGGVPMILGDTEGDRPMRPDVDEDSKLKVYHTFSRIHGDLERDYNAFSIDETFFSQGPGNYRDVAQNRRMDVMFQPRMGGFDVRQFLSFIQADGYEPLTVEAVTFKVTSGAGSLAEWAVGKGDGFKGPREALKAIFEGGSLRPGQLFQLMEDQEIKLKPGVSKQQFIDKFASQSTMAYSATFGDGFWADHWDYYLDLIDSYLAIYPEREEKIMFDEELVYYYAPASCQPRSKKYVATPTVDGEGTHVQQLGAMIWDADKTTHQNSFLSDKPWLDADANFQHTKKGEVFKSAPIAKLLLLAAQKFAMRDPYGMGVEYEGGKPGWNDAMNGLVGMIGSGMPETYELQLLLRYVEQAVGKYERDVTVPTELAEMIATVGEALDTLEASGFSDVELDAVPTEVPTELFEYWDTVATARETYREDIRFTFSGETFTYKSSDLSEILKRFILHTEIGMDRAMKVGSAGQGDDGTSGVAPSYFSYDVTSYTETGENDPNGHPYVTALGFTVGVFPLFLEGPVRMMKTISSDAFSSQMDVYSNVKSSGLYDSEQNAYTVSASLVGQSIDMGRMMAFSPGWLENQSIWTHMSYKFYLQLLRGKLYEVFFGELTGGGMLPFQDPMVYGRSLMECSSFVASSAFPDSDQHGRGFLARLSGSTAEFLSMWTLMFIGPHPFHVDPTSHELKMSLTPALPSWAFDEDGEATFKLFGEIEVTYHNEEGKDLMGVQPKRYEVNYKWHDGADVVESGHLPEYIAEQVRRLDVESIDAWF